MPALRILILSDGRPGHFNLSEGLAAAIARITPVEIDRLETQRGRLSGLSLAAITRARLPSSAMLKRVYGIRADDIPAFDIVISAGAETLAGNIWLARLRSAANLFYGSLRAFDPHDFAIVLTSYPSRATRPRHLYTLKPSRIDPDALPSLPRPPYGPDWPRTVGLIIGGDTRGVTFSGADWDALLELIRSTHTLRGSRWLVANSRRTPDPISDRLAALAVAQSDTVEEFLDVRTAGPGTLPQLLGRAEAIVCTADSSSMISESIWCRRPTISASPRKFVIDHLERSYRNRLEHDRLCRELPIATLTAPNLLDSFAKITPLTTNPQAELARRLVAALPALLERLHAAPEPPRAAS
jgi:mitochondrial fission protein ELM1